MKAKIFSRETLIGTAELKPGDTTMGGVYGTFFPDNNYYRYIRKSVRQGGGAGPEYYTWESLCLNVQLDNGCFVFACGGFTIEDSKELPDEPKRIDIAGVDKYIIEDYIAPEDPKHFLEDPWEAITIEQKILFEDELRKELGEGRNRGFWGRRFRSGNETHPLTDFEIAAQCRNGDDVLYRIEKKGAEETFAVVHLTWRGEQEAPGYPLTEFFKSFDEFKYFRMYPDKAEWEY